ncbi:hypothetical protein HELRODRAFT_153971 [Helobdella robusta]|uniref:DUF155 domain-containing protein n=1 Tax=Helobdella robusta TaxID=6412 RepID=T1ELD3_HELRO|nr:hypothetical protein HELRODRAFT_153971 [Helobdella robusta]ESO12843.1 hypothetical protein HELRODRAFT_153971 [Helobdella robusta]
MVEKPKKIYKYYDLSAYATAEEYQLETIGHLMQNFLPCTVQQLPDDALDVLHVQFNEKNAIKNKEDEETVLKNIFLFREGSIVFWNFTEPEKLRILSLIRDHQHGSYDENLIMEQLENVEFAFTDAKTSLVNGAIHIQRPQEGDVDHLEMFTFSNAISLSVKLAVWEASLEKYIESIESMLEDLKNGRKLRVSESDVLKKAGELFTLSHLINLSSDLLDTPDFYWDRDQLEKLYRKTCNFLNIPRRTKVMNEKLRQCVEFTELVRDYLKDKHHTRLELMIIFLIFIEVIYGSFHFLDRYLLKNDS